MRALLAAIVIAALGWSAFWWVGARGTDRDLSGWLDARHGAGWVANYAEVVTRGYPNRYDTTLREIELADPETGLAWSAPFLQLFRLSYQPRHVIAVWANAQVLATPEQRIEIVTEDARGSFVFERGDAWELERATVSADAIALTSTDGWTAALDSMRLATRPSQRVSGAIDLGLDLRGFRPASRALARMAAQGLLPTQIKQLRLDAALRFDAPWDRRAVEDARPNLVSMDLNRAEILFGQMEIWAAGEVTFDGRGRISGDITLKLRNWREMLELARTTRWLPERLAGPVERGLELLAGLAGSSETLDVPLTLTDGRASFGLIPLGQLPLIRFR